MAVPQRPEHPGLHYRGSVLEQHAVARLSGHRLLDEEDIAALEARIDAERAARELAERHSGLSEPLREILDLVAIDGLTPPTPQPTAHTPGSWSRRSRRRPPPQGWSYRR
ncbi:hypothetical protein [Streptomyces coelicoflavus]|uniref:hypothetical protein n=1 Tax=Streptomyces coelicoflavus TaxID=285562 RepID=UPI001FD04B3D|nr:hypothetical protein [Streptomyces coelicoflavus]